MSLPRIGTVVLHGERVDQLRTFYQALLGVAFEREMDGLTVCYRATLGNVQLLIRPVTSDTWGGHNLRLEFWLPAGIDAIRQRCLELEADHSPAGSGLRVRDPEGRGLVLYPET